MNVLRIEVLQPDVRNILRSLERMKLIRIQENSDESPLSDKENAKQELLKLFAEIDERNVEPMPMEEIMAITKEVRQKMYDEGWGRSTE